ncbi:hypothetical protein IKG54_02235, partial [Candidatus Saccharibacteria bacterium]|nr:hypothetical protein [Candidatus Saccharibacteria bacterium]
NRDADKFHIAPEYGEQGEGPGEQPVKRVEHMPTTDGFKKPVSISITEAKAEEKITEKPSEKSPFNHGEDDVMQYFTTEKKEEVSEEMSASDSHLSFAGYPGGHDRGIAAVRPLGRESEATPRNDGREERDPAKEMMRSASVESSAGWATDARSGISEHHPEHNGLSGQATGISQNVEAPHHKKKTNLISTIAIVLITVLVTAVVVFAILLFTQGHSKDNNITNNTNGTSKVETSSITCTKSDGTDEEKKAAGDATSINTTVIANYTGKDLDDYSVMKRYTYNDASAANAGLNKIKSAYTDKYVELLTINQDPFSSTYAQKEKEVTESHFASASDITSENITLINIPKVDDNGTVPDIDTVESTLKNSGYTCKVKSAD